jgi:hypothetical protein
MLEYKSKIVVLGPVAIKADQMEVHASWGEDWGAVRCPACPDKFFIGGPHPAFPSRFTKEQVTKDMRSVLADDHSHGRTHQNSYASWG